jgi:hypothetical protein
MDVKDLARLVVEEALNDLVESHLRPKFAALMEEEIGKLAQALERPEVLKAAEESTRATVLLVLSEVFAYGAESKGPRQLLEHLIDARIERASSNHAISHLPID